MIPNKKFHSVQSKKYIVSKVNDVFLTTKTIKMESLVNRCVRRKQKSLRSEHDFAIKTKFEYSNIVVLVNFNLLYSASPKSQELWSVSMKPSNWCKIDLKENTILILWSFADPRNIGWETMFQIQLLVRSIEGFFVNIFNCGNSKLEFNTWKFFANLR